MATLGEIDALTQDYADSCGKLGDVVQKMMDKVEQVKRKYLVRINALAKQTAQDKALLHEALDESRDLFVKPKTLVLHGVTIGLRKKNGSILVAAPELTLAKIRKLLPDQVDVLIRTKEEVNKEAVGLLSGDVLKKLGIEITADTEEVVIRAAVDKIQKVVDELVKEETVHQLSA